MFEYQDVYGYCPVCKEQVLFYAHHSFQGEWLYFCGNCKASMTPRTLRFVQKRRTRGDA